jgi:Mg2+-importing ATPase
MSSPGAGSNYWSQDAATLVSALGSGREGLSSAQAAAELARIGPNSIEDAARFSTLRLFLRQFESPLVLILAFAALISLALQQWVDAAIILAIILGSSLLGFLQEHRASTAVEKLKRSLTLQCRVMRDGLEQTVPVDTIVPGDMVLLSAGNLIPADGLVIEAEDFLVSEASMTGESFPVEKQPGLVAPGTPLAGRSNTVFLGASVRSGTARILVIKTGRRTEFGDIAARIRARPPETDFTRGVSQFGYLLLRVMVVIVLFMLLVNLLLGRPVLGSLLFAVAPCGGSVAGVAAGDHQRDPRSRCPGHEQAWRDCPPSRCHREPRQHGHFVHRQDRHPDRGQYRAARSAGWQRHAIDRGSPPRFSERKVRDRHRESA